MPAGVEVHESDDLFDSVQMQLDRICGLVTGDLFVSPSGNILMNIIGREGERPKPAS